MADQGFHEGPAGADAAVAQRRPRSLAGELVRALGDRVRDGRLAPGSKLPTEAQIVGEFGVSRTVVREALSQLQAAGLVRTRHGVGTFVVGPGRDGVFRIGAQQLETLRDVVAVLELRIGVETEAAALAAQRRTEPQLALMRQALHDFEVAVEHGRDAVAADFRFHEGIARATHNPHFTGLMTMLGDRIIPRARLDAEAAMQPEQIAYLRRVNAEHQSIVDAIARQDRDAARAAMRTHLANSVERRRAAAGGGA